MFARSEHNEGVDQSQVSVDHLLALKKRGRLSESVFARLMDWAVAPPARSEWVTSLRFWCLLFGMALITAGVVFFGAFNWSELSRFQKFGIMEGLVVAAFMGALLRGIDSVAGKVCLGTASVLVGVLLAVYGQVYQTGADSYRLFLGWGLLIALWTAASHSTVQWILQVTLLNVTFSLWWDQVLGVDFVWFGLAYLLMNGAIALVWGKLAATRGWMWKPAQEVFLCNALVPVTALACSAPWGNDGGWLSLVVLLGSLGYLFKAKSSSLPAMTIVATALVTVAGSFTIWIFHEADGFGFLLIAFAILGEMALAVRWLRGIHESAQEVASSVGDSLPGETESPAEQLAGLAGVDVSEASLALEPNTDMPWYVRSLTGFGAWIASWFLIGFFLIFFHSEDAIGIYGLTLCGVSLGLRRASFGEALFAQYACLSANLAGQIMVVVATMGTWFRELGTAAFCVMVLQAVMIAFYPDRVGRSLFAAGFAVAAGLLGGTLGDDAGWQLSVVLLALLLCLLWGKAATLLKAPVGEMVGPVGLGLASGLLGMLQVAVAIREGLDEVLFLAVAFTALAVGTALWFRAPLTAVLGLGLLGVATHAVPAIMAAVLVFLLSFHSRNRLGLVTSVCFLGSFLGFLYYSLALTLWLKSLTLVASGVIVLLVRLFLSENSTGEDEGGPGAF